MLLSATVQTEEKKLFEFEKTRQSHSTALSPQNLLFFKHLQLYNTSWRDSTRTFYDQRGYLLQQQQQ